MPSFHSLLLWAGGNGPHLLIVATGFVFLVAPFEELDELLGRVGNGLMCQSVLHAVRLGEALEELVLLGLLRRNRFITLHVRASDDVIHFGSA